jgi:hypothetical protein
MPALIEGSRTRLGVFQGFTLTRKNYLFAANDDRVAIRTHIGNAITFWVRLQLVGGLIKWNQWVPADP